MSRVTELKAKLFDYEEKTYAVRDDQNPIQGLIDAALAHPRVTKPTLEDMKNPSWHLFVGDYRRGVEMMKKRIVVTPNGTGWLYVLQMPRINLMLKVATSTRLAEDMSYNPF